MEKPQTITNSDLLNEYWLSQLTNEQKRTNELLEKLLDNLGKPARKKKGDDSL